MDLKAFASCDWPWVQPGGSPARSNVDFQAIDRRRGGFAVAAAVKTLTSWPVVASCQAVFGIPEARLSLAAFALFMSDSTAHVPIARSNEGLPW